MGKFKRNSEACIVLIFNVGCNNLIQGFVPNLICHLLQFNDFLNTIFSSPPTVALIIALFLDNTLEVENSKKDRGMPWWVKFRTFRGDSRNEEFYTLPFNLNKFFPQHDFEDLL